MAKCDQYGVEYVDHYIGKCGNGQNTRVIIKCPKHVNKGEYDMAWTAFKDSPHGCPYCSGKNKTTADFAVYVKDSVEMLSEYRGLYYKIKCRCRDCGHLWETKAANLKRGRGCPECGRRAIGDQKRKSEGKFVLDLLEVNPAIKLAGEYKTCKTLTQFHCDIHDCTWGSIPSNILNQSATCPECAAESFHVKKFLTNEEFVGRLQRVMPNAIPLEEYRGCREKINILCSIHGCIIHSDPGHLLAGKAKCPECADTLSFGERTVKGFLEDHNILYIPQATFDGCRKLNLLRFDFYIPSTNTAIEYDGEQHYYPVFPLDGTPEEKLEYYNVCVENDAIKNAYCIDNHVNLIRIPYWDLENINQILEKEFIHT